MIFRFFFFQRYGIHRSKWLCVKTQRHPTGTPSHSWLLDGYFPSHMVVLGFDPCKNHFWDLAAKKDSHESQLRGSAIEAGSPGTGDRALGDFWWGCPMWGFRAGQEMANDNPRDEQMARDGGSRSPQVHLPSIAIPSKTFEFH